MTKMNGRTAAALASATVLAASGVLAAAPALAQDASTAPAGTEIEQASGAQAEGIVSVAQVQGEFTYTQDALTLNDSIANVFMRAAASLCATAPDKAVACNAVAIAISGDVANSFIATVGEMSEADGSTTYTMGCTCASNGPGGGGVANAEVEGVSLASVYAQANA